MTKKKVSVVVLRDGGPDKGGDIIEIQGVKAMAHGVPVSIDFDDARVVGHAVISRSREVVLAEIEFMSQQVPRGTKLWPCVAGKVLKRDHQDRRRIVDLLIDHLALATSPNQDPRIEPIVLPEEDL